MYCFFHFWCYWVIKHPRKPEIKNKIEKNSRTFFFGGQKVTFSVFFLVCNLSVTQLIFKFNTLKWLSGSVLSETVIKIRRKNEKNNNKSKNLKKSSTNPHYDFSIVSKIFLSEFAKNWSSSTSLTDTLPLRLGHFGSTHFHHIYRISNHNFPHCLGPN